jgi:hypothetical protein
MYVPYIFPQESGGRTDVRWLAISDPASGAGLTAVSAGSTPEMQVSVTPCSGGLGGVCCSTAFAWEWARIGNKLQGSCHTGGLVSRVGRGML